MLECVCLSQSDWEVALQFLSARLAEIADFNTEDEEYIAVLAVVQEIERQLAGGMGKSL